MNSPLAIPIAALAVNASNKAADTAASKKRVLLIDGSRHKRDLRSETMRRLGIEVDCASDISEARCWWRAGLYDLVLMNVQEPAVRREKFCDDVRSANPSQHVMFLVGKPGYLSTAPEPVPDLVPELECSATAEKLQAAADATPQNGRWGILEACRRISAVRHVFEARAEAIRNRPAPPRDPEGPGAKRSRVIQSDYPRVTEDLR